MKDPFRRIMLLLLSIVLAVAAAGCSQKESPKASTNGLKETEGLDDGLFVDPHTVDLASDRTIDKLFAPYQAVIDALNAELSPDFLITEDKKETVYNHYKDYTLEEFEQELRDKHAHISKDSEGLDGYILVGAEFFDAASGEE